MELTEREKFLLVAAISEYLAKLRQTSYYLEGLGIKYHKKKIDDVRLELMQLREKVADGEWEQYLKDYIES
ncbi:hypothetical protein [Caloramator australicus]|uniref:Uncharacterized protein n=1 Tax=Caloramator australicus RC3 TaxID=857293 RepID=I7KTG3_9CLOT|nr:hypothetical protein [Caloramator australicus]CCJ33048.1 hypothetical protein CAAU_0964 [Caloramator australicus RC3]